MKMEIAHEGQVVGSIATRADGGDGYVLTGDHAVLERFLDGMREGYPRPPREDAAFLATLPRQLDGWYWSARVVDDGAALQDPATEAVKLFNPNHDPSSGRFAPGGLGGHGESESAGEGGGMHGSGAKAGAVAHHGGSGGGGGAESRHAEVWTSEKTDEAGFGVLHGLFGRSLSHAEIASLVGAKPTDSVQVEMWPRRPHEVTLNLQGKDEAGEPTYRGIREITRNELGDVVIHNVDVEVYNQGEGIGTALFARQARAGQALGVAAIVTTAKRTSSHNGYYTWARLGYNAPLTHKQMAALPRALRGATDLHTLMRTPAGRDWWRSHGETFQGEFDLTPGSASMRVLDTYLQERGIHLSEGQQGMDEEIEWTEADEAAANRAWARIDAELRQQEQQEEDEQNAHE